MAGARRWALVLALAAALPCPALAPAYVYYRTWETGALVRWPGDSFGFLVNTEGMPVGSAQAIQDSMNAWSNAGAKLVIINQGGTDSHEYGKRDSMNIIDRGELDWRWTVSETVWWYDRPSGHVTDADIRLNHDVSWGAGGESDSYDVQSVITHELGHALALGDLFGPGDRDKTMYGPISRGETKKRTLEDDDKEGVRFLYP